MNQGKISRDRSESRILLKISNEISDYFLGNHIVVR
jgi:hypothetical protein